MKRLAILLAVVASAGVWAVLTHQFADTGYRVDAIFDTADGISKGMNVEVGGVPVGSVVGVKLTRGLKARLQLSVQRRFAPFHTDATCQILPEGIISENYVQCDPGSHVAAQLTAQQGTPPTVPLGHDATPVSLQQFIDIFSVPVADRLQLLLNELGISTAGRGEDLNQILQRANPSITQADRVLSTINAQRAQLTDAIGQTNQVITQLATRPGAVRRFVDEAASTARVTADHRGALAAAINRLPAFLDETARTSDTLHTLSTGAIPLLDALRADGPALSQLTTTVPQFTTAATPAVSELSDLAATGRTQLTDARPALTALHNFTAQAPTGLTMLDQFLSNVQQRGGLEYAQELFYGLATATAPFDSISHVLTLNAIVTPCVATPTATGCDRGWGTTQSREAAAGGSSSAASRRARQPSAHRQTTSPGPTPTSTEPTGPTTPTTTSRSAPTPTTPTTSTPALPALPATPTTPTAPPSQALLGLLHYLTK